MAEGFVVHSSRTSGRQSQGNPTPEDSNRVEPEVSMAEVSTPLKDTVPVVDTSEG